MNIVYHLTVGLFLDLTNKFIVPINYNSLNERKSDIVHKLLLKRTIILYRSGVNNLPTEHKNKKGI